MAKEAPLTLDRLSAINADGSRRHIHPADVTGRFVSRRRLVYFVLIAIYVGVPFLSIGGHPAVQLDIEARRFYLLGAVFNAQDVWRSVFLLLTIGTGLFFVTTWYGRIWCGWACPQTVFLEGVFRRIERWTEGPREQRLRLEAAPLSFNKVARKATKHFGYLVVSLVLANVALSFFVSLPSALQMVRHNPLQNWVPFLWVAVFTAAMYFNFAWFREQLCIVVCPYGRLQSSLLDRDSIIIGYDVKRGEPRGRISRAQPGVSLPVVQKGDCVDCSRCVAVCPTAIDIRNGGQMECIGCAQCIDACDDVMKRLNRPTGLIRYDSQAGLDGEERQVLRPRLFLYAGLLAVSVIALIVATIGRTPFEANVIRLGGMPYVMDEQTVRNQFELHLVNKNSAPTTFHLEIVSPVPLALTLGMNNVQVGPLEHFRLPVFATVPRAAFARPFDFVVRVRDSTSGQEVERHVQFLGPQSAGAP